jgi:signal peptidase I
VTGPGSDGPDANAPGASSPDASLTADLPGAAPTSTGVPTLVVPAADETGTRPSPDAAPTGSQPKKGAARVALEWVVLIAVALAIAFVIKTFLFQAFYIPSPSMTPTLEVGDRVLVNKLSYDFHDVNRGDIIVFDAPPRARAGGIEDLVKRTIGLPGDTITGDDAGGVLVNGRRLKEPYLPKGTLSSFTDVPPGCGAPKNGQPGCVVPKDHLFMMGDNRENSKDSRVFGPVPESTLVGRVFVRIWPLSSLGLL